MNMNQPMNFDLNSPVQSQHPHHPTTASTSSGEPKWMLPSIITSSDEDGLRSLPVETLSDCLRPVYEGLQTVDAESLLGLERVEGNGAILRDGIRVRPIHTEIAPKRDERTVRYIHLSEVPNQYSMGIFVFPPFSRIPLHDHPGMCVLSRVLYGDLRRLSLDLIRESTSSKSEKASTGWFSSWNNNAQASSRRGGAQGSNLPKDAKRAYKNGEDHLVAPGCTMLYPYEGNLHEFVAGPDGAAVLDVLLPPYDVDHHRDCTFYYIKDDDGNKNAVGDNNNKASALNDKSNKREACWIIPTGQPEDFHCISGRYRALGEAE